MPPMNSISATKGGQAPKDISGKPPRPTCSRAGSFCRPLIAANSACEHASGWLRRAWPFTQIRCRDFWRDEEHARFGHPSGDRAWANLLFVDGESGIQEVNGLAKRG